MTAFQIALLALSVPLTCLLACYGLHRVHLLWAYLKRRNDNPVPEGELADWPTVLVQVPVFNEGRVVRRVLEAVAAFDYPKDRLSIQLLDDSTDDTPRIGARVCRELLARGFRIEHLRRTDRSGFKAGALAEGLLRDDSEFVAIFDADFVPEPDFLKRTVPYFAKPSVGLVQARWDHLNMEENLLTRLQSFLIDGHFVMESTTRNRTGRFFNFNGTGGIWRRSCIDDAGGWSSRAGAEDAGISLRAYLKGWKFVFLRDLTVPAELPADAAAYKSQQHRWAKGYTEILKAHLPTIWRAPLPFMTKVEATLMLSNHFAFLLFGVLTILHLPIVLVRAGWHASPFVVFLDVLGLNLVLFAFFAFYVVSQREAGRLTWKRLAHVPLVLGLGMALMVNSCRAVLEALFGLKTGFVRTPKEGDRPDPSYKARAAVIQALTEVSFGLYLIVSTVVLVARGHWLGAPLNLLVAFGFLFLGLPVLKRQWAPAPAPRAEPAPKTVGV